MIQNEVVNIRNLAQTDLADIVDCLTEAFKNYYVKMPSEVDFWANRFHAARVDYNLSFGVFDNDKLVAFIIHGVDHHHGLKTAFNTGTGVLKEYRGRHLVDQLYSFAIPILKENGIEKMMLEVIDENQRAIKVYERIGFQKDRFLRCFTGESPGSKYNATLGDIKISDLDTLASEYQKFYSWDNAMDAIIKGGEMFKAFVVKSNSEDQIGYFVINSQNKALIQIESFQAKNWSEVIEAVNKTLPSIKINNVDNNRQDLIIAFQNAGLENHINQFEMTLLF